MQRDDPPWIKLLPDPLPPTTHRMGGELRESAPGVHSEVVLLVESHPVLERDRSFVATVFSLFVEIVTHLPPDLALRLIPAPSGRMSPTERQRALNLLTRSGHWRSRADDRLRFSWPYQEIYEWSDAIRARSMSRHVPAQMRRAALAAHRLFVRLARRLAEMFEHHWVPRTRRQRL